MQLSQLYSLFCDSERAVLIEYSIDLAMHSKYCWNCNGNFKKKKDPIDATGPEVSYFLR